MKTKRIALPLAVFLALSTPLTVLADTVSGINFTNNTDKTSDYKLTNEQISNYSKQIETNSNVKEIFLKDNGRELGDLNSIHSYLIEHNIITREGSITANASKPMHTELQKENLDSSIDKSDFLMALYKAEFEVIPSRPVIVNTQAERTINGTRQQVITTDKYTPQGYTGTDKTFDFSNGDYSIFVSPNVHELYLSKLLDKGIIKDKEIKNKDFVEQYKINGSKKDNKIIYSAWDNKLPAYQPLTGNEVTENIIYPAYPLGYSWNISNYKPGDNIPLTEFQANRRLPSFFVSEDMRTIDALRYIEQVLRLKEKNITDTEAKMVAYKYGTSYLLKLDASVRKTILYLVAMGVINFENPQEYGNLYAKLDRNYAYELLYRVNNKAGRVDFTKIQLTDSDNFWMDKGYVQQKVQMEKGTEILPQPITLDVETAKAKKRTNPFVALLSIIGLDFKFSGIKYSAPSGDTVYTVTKEFFKPDSISYKGTPISKLKSNGDVTVKKNNSTSAVIEFKQSAPNPEQAIASVDSLITLNKGNNKLTTMESVTKVDNKGSSITYISADVLRNNFSELVILNDKTLKNKVTGDTAMLLKNSHMAMVGNTVIHSDDNMIMTINRVQYYNLAMIIKLMTNAFISKIDPNKIYVEDNMNKEIIAPVIESGNLIEHVPVINPGAIRGVSASNGVTMYNQNLLTRGVTTLIRDYQVNVEGKNVNTRLIVDWGYAMPKHYDELKNISNSKNFSVKKASEFLFTRPEDGELQRWWDNNIGLSNALANLVYGTNDTQYIKSGYLKPDVTLLIESNDKKVNKTVESSILEQMQFPSGYIQNNLSGNAGNWWTKLFNQTGNSLSAHRRFRELNGLKQDFRWNFEGKYLTTQYGTTYRAINDDPRIKWNGSSVLVNARTDNTQQTYAIGSVAVLNGHKFFVDGFGGGNGRYLRLIALEPIAGTAIRQGGKNNDAWIVKKSGYNMVEGAIHNYQRNLNKDSYLKTDDYNDNPKTLILPVRYLTEGLYCNNTKLTEVSNVHDAFPKFTDRSETNGKVAIAHPVLYLDRLQYVVENGKIIAKKTNPFIEQGNVFFSGLNSSMISNLLDKALKVTKYKDLPSGAKVVIQDVLYTKTSHGLISDPIKNQHFANQLGASVGQSEKSTEGVILSLYSGLHMNCSGRLMPFSSYIKEADIGILLDKSKADYTLYKEGINAKLAIDKSQTRNYEGGSSVKSGIAKILPTDDLGFIEIDSNSHLYTIKYTTDKYSNGYIDDVSMFHDTLTLSINDDLYLRLEKTKFHPMRDAQKYREQFQKVYQGAWNKSLKAFLQMIFTTALMYLIVISWVCYAIVKFGLGKQLFLMIKDPLRTSDRTGIDIIKLVSFGMFSLDDEPEAYRLFISNLLMFILLYIVVNVI